MTVPDSVRKLLREFTDAQARPVTDYALVDRMRTEATTWVNGVHMQHRRVTRPLVDLEAPGDEIWRQGVDLHFLLVALTRLRRAVGLTVRVAELQESLLDMLVQFDRSVPSLATLRNVAEHFDDYTTGKGHARKVERHQLQVWSLGDRDGVGLVWSWLGVEFAVEPTHQAATKLYRGFLAEANQYLAKPQP